MSWRVLGVGFLILCMGTQPSSNPVPAPPAVKRVDSIPLRDENAITGTRFAEQTEALTGPERQATAVDELLKGNVPQFLRQLRPIRLEHVGPDGPPITASVWVMPDYLAIGSDTDFLYIPLALSSAIRVANQWGFVLPTRKIVDAVYAQSDHHLEPIPLPPGPKMRSSAYFLRHQRLIEEQRGSIPLGALLSGHKKDVVLTNRLAVQTDRIAIYGWHRSNGDPIQPLSTLHGSRYTDYSHGVRLVWNQVWIEGRLRSIYDVLRDPRLAPALTYEGSIRTPRRLGSPSG